ncbi:MAG: multiheme c-type cytochrome [Prolixibacteraceae bacterium]|jgi:hypothetical protein
MNLHKIKKFFQFDTAGWIATSSLLLCAISGILLTIPYDFTRAHQSVSEMLLFNPFGTLVRNFHYWSAQLFFIFSILHIYDHFSKSTETNIRNRRTWLILCVALFFMGYEMISGFILKGDAAGIQARRILASLLETIPFAGRMLSAVFTGLGDNVQAVYIQHVATGTIMLFVAVYEHVRKIWPKQKSGLIIFIFLLVISLFLRAPLGLVESSEVKGPWFFVGIQELLHLSSHPVYVVLLIFIFLTVVYFLPKFRIRVRKGVKIILLVVGITYLILTVVVLLFRGENWQWHSIRENKRTGDKFLIFDPVNIFASDSIQAIPENQKAESCLVCHSAMKGLSDSHNPSAIGCFSCHKGDPYSTNKTLAHRNMILIPGNLSNAQQTCGTQSCHPDITGRMMKSLMTTQSGIVGVDKFIFQETESLDDTFDVKNLGHSAADTHLRNLCAGCHLANDKKIAGNVGWLDRGGGCNACHLHYSDEATESLKRMQAGTSSAKAEIHPTIDIQVSNDRCLSCHSRSGRISLNYEGWNEVGENAKPKSIKTKELPDKRVLEFIQADVHHEGGMACIDCHISYDLMGDGIRHIHKEDAVHIQCIDCHSSGKTETVKIADLPDYESQMVAWLRKYNPKTKVVLTANGSYPLMNTSVDSLGRIFLSGKLDGKERLSKPAASVCTRGEGHSRLSCESCHTSWVPQCIGCHNAYEKETSGFDLLTGKTTKGTWVEYVGNSFPEPPVLGVNEKPEAKIVTAMPGMVMTIDKESFEKGAGKSFHRLYAPASGHTTQREGRSCKSCHNNPLAIGFGRGDLVYRVSGNEGKWSFNPMFALNENDSLPEDAWIGFLKEAKAPFATRTSLRPFHVAEQKKILEVGACLTCHDEKSKVMDLTLENYRQALIQRSKKCILPVW